MPGGSVQLAGAIELDARLRELPKAAQGKAGRQALRAGAKVVQQRAQRDAPRRAGGKKKNAVLAKSIKVRAVKRNRRGLIGFNVQTAAGNYRGRTFYGAFIEFGHKSGRRTAAQARAQRNKAQYHDVRKQVPANPFMQRAFDETKHEALDVVSRRLWQAIVADFAG